MHAQTRCCLLGLLLEPKGFTTNLLLNGFWSEISSLFTSLAWHCWYRYRYNCPMEVYTDFHSCSLLITICHQHVQESSSLTKIWNHKMTESFCSSSWILQKIADSQHARAAGLVYLVWRIGKPQDAALKYHDGQRQLTFLTLHYKE